MESQIVGYESISLTPGNQVIRGVMFKDVSNTDLPLQAIKMDANTAPDGTTHVWWWNGAFYDAHAVWCYECDEDGDYLDKDGNKISEEDVYERGMGNPVWGDETGWIAIDHTFQKGDCFWIQPGDANESSAMVPAGALVTCDTAAEFVEIELTPGAQVQVTNPMPVSSFTFNDVAMDEATEPDGTTHAWWWNGAFYDPHAVWCYECDEDGDYLDKDGNKISEEDVYERGLGNPVWGDETGWIRVQKTFSAGEGFWVQPGDANESSSILFKNPLYKAN